MIPLYFGHDERTAVGTSVFVGSVLEHASERVALHPITRLALRGVREGSNAFTFRRFLVPWMQSYEGWAIFADGADMLCCADIAELWRMRWENDAVMVVKHDYQTRHPRKYLGTAMEAANADYPRKNWASLMLINCAHYAWRKVDPAFVDTADPMELLQLAFLPERRVGALPACWNWLVDESGPSECAKLLHFTAGIPAFQAYEHAPMAERWHAARERANSATGVM